VLDALYRFVQGVPLDRHRDFTIFNASLNTVCYTDGRWTMERWGDISHLTRDAALDDF
jgi:broad specificity phosphatase PhoE